MQSTTPQSAARPSAYLLAALVVGLALGSVHRAYAVGTNPNQAIIRYVLAPNTELPIVVPVFNQAVRVMATCETLNDRGIAVAEVVKATAPSPVLLWTGQNSNTISSSTSGVNTSGSSSADEDLIVTVDNQGEVGLEVQNATTMAISNELGATRAGYVTMIW